MSIVFYNCVSVHPVFLVCQTREVEVVFLRPVGVLFGCEQDAIAIV